MGKEIQNMFCFQCEQTAGCDGCSGKVGVCGKTAEVANLQDELTGALIGLARSLNGAGKVEQRTSDLVIRSLFATLTNVNFNEASIKEMIAAVQQEKDSLKPGCRSCANPCGMTEDLQLDSIWKAEENIRSLKSLVLFGLRGMAAYAYHAMVLGFRDEEVNFFFMKALFLLGEKLTVEELLPLVDEVGEKNLLCLELLDRANTESYGNPEPTEVPLKIEKGPFIVISGHDLLDLKLLLEQTDGKGVNVYTHGEMLPAHYYPAFKKYSHFVGNYGNAWWKQREEFTSFNGPILFTTNCIVPPLANAVYKERMFTTNSTGYPGCKYIDKDAEGRKDFSEIIEIAKQCQPPVEIEHGEIIGGFAHNQVLQLADKVVDAVKSGAIHRFIVMAGCDGRMKSRDYYTEFAKALPQDTVILTAGCAKYRYNKLGLGDINGIPRVLDAGQCNDSYSLAVIAMKLKEVFQLNDINELPIVYNIAWYEQKAVIVLLALLSLGVKDIHLGPTLPAFLSPNVVKVLVDMFHIAGIGSVEDDLKKFGL